MSMAPDPDNDRDLARQANRFWWSYMTGVAGLAVFAVIFGQFFLALEFSDNLGKAAIDRLLAIGVVALFLERAIEVYIVASRRFGEMEIDAKITEASEEHPDDRKLRRHLQRERSIYKLHTLRIAFTVSLFCGVLIACTGLRVLDGLIVLGEFYKENPVWQSRVWFGVDILLTGGMIGGGATGIHGIINVLNEQIPKDKSKK